MPPSPAGSGDHPDSSWPFNACSPPALLPPKAKGVADADTGARLDSERREEVKDDVVEERERPPGAILSSGERGTSKAGVRAGRRLGSFQVEVDRVEVGRSANRVHGRRDLNRTRSQTIHNVTNSPFQHRLSYSSRLRRVQYRFTVETGTPSPPLRVELVTRMIQLPTR